MKYLSDNLLTLVLTLVLGISPLQNISASVSKCMTMNKSTHMQMKMLDKSTQTEINKSETKHDCCSDNACGTTHCASSIVAAIPSSNINDITYNLSNTYQKLNDSLIPFYPSSLYRPPRV